jgi:hypothetical protein
MTTKKDKKVVILGFTIEERDWEQIPWENESWEIWGMNHLWRREPKRYTRWFEVHSLYNIKNEQGKGHWEWIRDCPVTVYMAREHKRVKNCIRYPIERMVERFGPVYTNTVDYEMALAMDLGFTDIWIIGLPFTSIDEILLQRHSFCYFVGRAKERANVKISKYENPLRQYKMYGDFDLNGEEYYKYL